MLGQKACDVMHLARSFFTHTCTYTYIQPFLLLRTRTYVVPGRGDVVMSILTDVNGFIAYENRENLSESDEYQAGEEGWQ